MTMLADLTPAQREQVTFLFHDELFNVDPAAYDYKVGRGEVVLCRRPLVRDARTRFPRKHTQTILLNPVKPTAEQQASVELLLDMLARRVIENILRSNRVTAPADVQPAESLSV